jgi:hypothetical protein
LLTSNIPRIRIRKHDFASYRGVVASKFDRNRRRGQPKSDRPARAIARASATRLPIRVAAIGAPASIKPQTKQQGRLEGAGAVIAGQMGRAGELIVCDANS